MQNKMIFVVFAIALFVGLYIRVGYLNYGLPFVFQSDELTNYNVIQRMVVERDANPGFFRYPSLLFYLNVPVQIIVANLNDGLLPIYKQTRGTGFTEQPVGLWAARIVSLTFCLALISLAMNWAREIIADKSAVLLTGLLVALCPLLVRHSVYLTPDIIAAFFVAAALMSSSMILKTRAVSWYITAGIFAGLAASVKYNAGAVAIALLVAHVLVCGVRIRKLYPLGIAGLFAIAVLLLTSPFLLLDFKNASARLLFEIKHYSSGHPGAEGKSLIKNAGWIYAQAGFTMFLAIGCLILPQRKLLAPAFSFIVLYFLLLSLQTVRFERNILLILPAIFLLATAGAYALIDKLQRFVGFPDLLRISLFSGIVAISFAMPLLETKRDLTYFTRDPRLQSRQWLEQVIPNDAKVILDAYSPFLTTGRREILTSVFVLNQKLEWFENHDYVVITFAGSGRFLEGGYDVQNATYSQLSDLACEKYIFPESPRRTFITVLKMDCEIPG